jgi:tRNA pseudouridine38-40 synthase
VAAGAISKANAEDPKKSSLVRCARTDKGVHAAGNVVSLKMIVEDSDIVQKINDNLSPQIRVWGIEVTNKSFSCYQLCDSRMYEYLIPSHCFLPPHPSTYLGQKIKELAEENGQTKVFLERQQEVSTFWNEVDERDIKPILAQIPEDIRQLIQKALVFDSELRGGTQRGTEPSAGVQESEEAISRVAKNDPISELQHSATEDSDEADFNSKLTQAQRDLLGQTIKSIKAAYVKAKRLYRIPEQRIRRIQDALDKYIGTQNFHNYTIQKLFQDPSSKRHIKSFVVNTRPIIIDGTEWLSMKVHGQSFMMHQIRKMVAMVALVVRCGCDPKIIRDSYGPEKIPIPKAPGLGLLLERPVFDSYNKRAKSEFGKNPIDFAKYEMEMEEFKQREIYNRIFREDAESNA